MSYSLSGSIITQSATNATLAGIEAIAGVTLSSFGGLDVYDLGTLQLLITGDQTINAFNTGAREQLLIGTGNQGVIDLEVSSAGNLIAGYNSVSVDGSYIIGQHHPSIVEKDLNLHFGTSRAKNDTWDAGTTRPFLLIRGGGQFTWNGVISANGGIGFDGFGNGGNTDSIIKLNNAVWDASNVGENALFDQILYSYTRNIEVNGLTVLASNTNDKGVAFTQLANPLFPVKGYTGVFTDLAFSGSTSVPDGFVLVIEDYAGIIGHNTASDIQVQGKAAPTAGDITFLNGAKGSNLILAGGVSDSLELIKAEQSVTGFYVDGSGTDVSDFVVGTIDKNQLLYSDNTGTGSFDLGQIRMARWDGGVGISDMVKTIFNPSDTGDDLWDLYSYSFDFLPRKRLQSLFRDTGGKVVDFILSDDLSKTEADRSIVDAYTLIDDLSKLYDRSKSNKVSNVTLPSIDVPQIEAKGNSLDLGLLELVVNDFGSAYTCSATEITIRVF